MMKKRFLLAIFFAFAMQPVFATDNNVDTSEIFSDQNVRVSKLSTNEMKNTQGAFLRFADFSHLINNQVSSATAVANGAFATSLAISNNIAVNINTPVIVNAPVTINFGRWR